MLEANKERLLQEIPDDARVLDVGGWYIPFARADYVVDLLPYETRGLTEAGQKERFSAGTWVQLDVCQDPLPFEDDYFDFVVCSHTLEDIRDPVFLCGELRRVAKAGYIETPSKVVELTFGIEDRRYAGYRHHRWLVSVDGTEITFRHKSHFIHGAWQFHLPKRMARKLPQDERVTWMFWKGGFEFREIIVFDLDQEQEDIASFVRGTHARPRFQYQLLPVARAFGRMRDRAGRAVRSTANRSRT